MIDWQFFVPAQAYVIQSGVAVLGACVLLVGGGRLSGLFLVSSAYPVGAALVGLVAWAAFLLGQSSAMLMILGLIAGTGLAAAAVRVWRGGWAFTESPWGTRPGRVALAGILGGVALGGWLLNQSGDLAEADPRWQLAYRARIMATQDGPDTPLFQDPEVLHVNRKYPLLFSGLEAVTLRLMGGPDAVAAVRPIAYFYYLALFLALAADARRRGRPWAGVVTLLVLLTLAKVQALGLDEVYADLPLGISAFFLFLWLNAGDAGPCRAVALVVLGGAVAGLKAEGLLLAAVVGLCYGIVRASESGWLATGRDLSPMLAGIAATAGLQWLWSRYTPAEVRTENLQLSDVQIIGSWTKAQHVPVILRALATCAVRLEHFGLFVPLCLVGAVIARNRRALLPLAMAAIYLAILVLPLALAPGHLDVRLQFVVPRLYVQITPLLALALFEGLVEAGL